MCTYKVVSYPRFEASVSLNLVPLIFKGTRNFGGGPDILFELPLATCPTI